LDDLRANLAQVKVDNRRKYSAGRVETGFPTRPGFCGFAVVRA